MSSDSSDPLYYMRVILASNRGTLMELGITPIVTSSMIMQLLAGANLIEVDFSLKEDRALFSGGQKRESNILWLENSADMLHSLRVDYFSRPGYRIRPHRSLWTPVTSALVSAFSSSTNLSLPPSLSSSLTNSSRRVTVLVLASTFSLPRTFASQLSGRLSPPTTVNTGRGPEFEGALVALFHLVFTWNDKGRALREAFWRDRLPNIMNLLATVIIFAVVIYLQGFRIEIPIKSNKFRGQRGTYPVKLFYTSDMPIMLESALTSNIFIVSQMLASRFPNNLFVKLLGVREVRRRPS